MGELEEIKNDIKELKDEIAKIKKEINTTKNNHGFDMEFVSKQMDILADKIGIDLDAEIIKQLEAVICPKCHKEYSSFVDFYVLQDGMHICSDCYNKLIPEEQ